jgi:hypothetical protein
MRRSLKVCDEEIGFLKGNTHSRKTNGEHAFGSLFLCLPAF